jgi:carboxymethylenebutenolidase
MNYFMLSSLSIVLSLLSIFQPKPSVSPLLNPAQAPIAMCHSGDLGMAAFVDDPNFVALHPSPLPLDYNELGSSVSFATPDGQNASGYLVKAKKKSNKWLFVYQEWWGLNANIKQQADVFYTDLGGAVNVIALDMYDGKVTADPKEAGNLMRGMQEARLENIVKGAMQLAGKKAKIANVGWCFGGSWSLKSAILGSKQTVGSVMYYGMPVQDVEKLKTLNCDVLGLFATEEYISKKIIEDFAANMKTAGKSLTYKIFAGVHGFANPSNPRHDAAQAKEAYGMALTYLKQKFGV